MASRAMNVILRSHLSTSSRIGCAARINKNISTNESSPIVSKFSVSELADKVAFCRCWLSSKFPKCDGSHVKHNTATGDNVGPVVVEKPKK
ncbi:unnamed protein product [Notodromas monacha]|uniref:Iron-binding zinc finger CDGSH type domain-containing protein n=1 Tax=Notodromas monacha TaxID=399045 RepID=A0A7R9C285_9CRUS|nr:unnamed protein product [Notodromas monacha]CAG0924744.1 unnamed protein product [Notodromas monacha]